MILYADIFIIINGFCDWLALWSCGKLLSLRLMPLRGALSVAVLTLYALLSTLMGWSGAVGYIMDLIFLCLGCAAAYKVSSFAQFMKIVAVFFVCCVFIGGVAGWLSGISQGRLIFIIILTPLIYFIWINISRTGLKSALKKHVRVSIDGESMRGLVDSGNFLTDPLSGLPVIIISRKALPSAFMYRCTPLEINTVAGTEHLDCFIPDTVTIGKTRVYAAVALCKDIAPDCDCIVPLCLI